MATIIGIAFEGDGMDLMETSIKSYRQREMQKRKQAVEAIEQGLYGSACTYLIDAAKYQSAAEELEFQIEAAE